MVKKNKQKTIPAVTHQDGSGRVQTVEKKINTIYYSLLCEFKKITSILILLNTSSNINGEPIICSPNDAIKIFNSCGLDILVIGNYLINK